MIMITKLHYWWQEKRSSFWFVTAVMVLDAVVLATLLITVDATVEEKTVMETSILISAIVACALLSTSIVSAQEKPVPAASTASVDMDGAMI
jgi:uncharacterized membrane protein